MQARGGNAVTHARVMTATSFPSARRKPTYGTATRLARIVLGLLERPYGWSFEALEEELRIGERTLLRYLAACRREVVDSRGRPLIEVVRRGPRRLLRLADTARTVDANPYQVLFLYFALAVFQFLDGTVIKQGIEDLWERFYRALPDAQRLRLADFPKKFYAVPYAMKDYRSCDDTLDVLVQCLVYQHRMRIDYFGLLGEGHVHEFDPYTLTMYRGGLYVIGYSHRFRRIIYLAVERIRAAEKLAEHFNYPKTYTPQKYTEGTFGIIDGPETRVELLLRNADTAAYLASRRLHPTQRFAPRRNGTTLLTMTVRGTTELVPWILSLGPYVEVRKPRALRDEVRQSLGEAMRVYARDAELTRRKPPHATRRQVRRMVTRGATLNA
jgi:predicted DNA-binding transcriptional regulator YafY